MQSEQLLIQTVTPTIDRAVDKSLKTVSYPGVVIASWLGTGDIEVQLDMDAKLTGAVTFASVQIPIPAIFAGTRVRVEFNGNGRAIVNGIISTPNLSGWQDLTLINGWSAVSGLPPRYLVDNVTVWLDGQLTGGAVGTVAARINKAPSQNHTFTAGTHDATNGYGAAVIGIGTDGTITVLSVGSDWVDLGMHSYLTA